MPTEPKSVLPPTPEPTPQTPLHPHRIPPDQWVLVHTKLVPLPAEKDCAPRLPNPIPEVEKPDRDTQPFLK